MKRYIGLDLGTKTCGVAIADVTNSIIFPHSLIKFPKERYDIAAQEIKKIIEKEKVTDVVIGLPKNMDGSLGFASARTLNFIPLIESDTVSVHTQDERLSSVEAQKILREHNIDVKKSKDKIDMAAASLILETYLRCILND